MREGRTYRRWWKACDSCSEHKNAPLLLLMQLTCCRVAPPFTVFWMLCTGVLSMLRCTSSSITAAAAHRAKKAESSNMLGSGTDSTKISINVDQCGAKFEPACGSKALNLFSLKVLFQRCNLPLTSSFLCLPAANSTVPHQAVPLPTNSGQKSIDLAVLSHNHQSPATAQLWHQQPQCLLGSSSNGTQQRQQNLEVTGA